MGRPMDAKPLAYSSHKAELPEATLQWPGRNRHASFEPNHSVAMPRSEKNPTTSVTVVTNTPEGIAGSATEAVEHERHQNAAEGPCHKVADHGETDHHAEIGHLEPRPAATPVMTAKAKPLTSPTSTSRRTRRAALALDNSCVASARTATVMVWGAALPPWLATIGA